MTSPEPQTDFEENLPQTSYEPTHKQRRWLRLLLAFILIIGGGTAVVWRLLVFRQEISSIAPAPGVRVQLSSVQFGTVEDSTDYIASLESRRSVTLQSRISGQITQIFVKPGDPITTGTAVIQVDSRQQPAVNSISNATQISRVQLENARATLKSLEAERLSNLADLRSHQQDYERYAILADQGAVSRQTKQQYAERLVIAKAKLDAINSRIQIQQATISQTEQDLQQVLANTNNRQIQSPYERITAPLDGTVSEIPVKTGDFVNNFTRLVTITQNRPLEVNISVPLEQASQLRKGMLVEVMNVQGQVLGTSRVFSIAPEVNNNTRTILIKALFNNSQGQLRPNQLARARVIWSQRSGILIPTTAVSRVGRENFVYVAQTETSAKGVSQLIARRKLVKLGNIKGNNYQVLEGLQPEDQIVISGLLNLRDGLPIVPESL